MMLAVDARVRLLAGLVARVARLVGAVAALEREQQLAVVDELVARVVRHRVHPGVHPDGVARARLDAVAAEDAPQLVDDELDRIALVPAALVAHGILAGLDEDALGRARRGAAEARDAADAPVVARRQAVDAAEALGVRALLLRV